MYPIIPYVGVNVVVAEYVPKLPYVLRVPNVVAEETPVCPNTGSEYE